MPGNLFQKNTDLGKDYLLPSAKGRPIGLRSLCHLHLS